MNESTAIIDDTTTTSTTTTPTLTSTAGVTSAELEQRLAELRGELTGYCYRMLGSAFDADDAVQETAVRAWRAIGRFEGRSSLRSWLYRIATNVCFDSLSATKRRARPMDLGPSSPADSLLAPPLTEQPWLGPIPDVRVVTSTSDPSDAVVLRESIRLAFVAALQHLPPRQRAVLILKEVLSWHADEIAELLDATVASVNSALQRARATLASVNVVETDPFPALDPAQEALLASYVDAFERYDLDCLVALLHEDVTSSMPPYALWLRGHQSVRDWFLGTGRGCRGSRLVPTAANGAPAFGQYRASGPHGEHEPWSLQVLEIVDGVIVGMNFFLEVDRLFPLFGLPAALD